MPRDSLTAQMICCSAAPPSADAAVLGLVLGLPELVRPVLDRLVAGLVVLVTLSGYEGYDADVVLYEVDTLEVDAIISVLSYC